MNGQAVRAPAYAPEFKAECVERVLHDGATPEDTRRVAEEMGVPESTLIYWINTARQGLADAEDMPPDEQKETRSMPQRKRRQHSPEFRAAAVARVLAGEHLPTVADDVDVVHTLLRGWVKKAKEEARTNEKAQERANKRAEKQAARPSARHQPEPPTSQLTLHPRTHVLPPNESATTMALRAENELLKRRNRLLKDMLDLAMKDHGLSMIEAEHG